MNKTNRFSRRTLLGGGAVAILLIGVGGAGLFLTQSGKEELTRSVLARLIGTYNMSAEHFALLVEAVDRDIGYPKGYKLNLASALERSGWADEMLASAPADIKNDFALLERRILTEFVVGTNYLTTTDRAQDELVFTGFQACSSPFANFAVA